MLETTTNGLKGTVIEWREADGFVVLDLNASFPGKAFVKLTDLSSQPPFRHQPGTRVATPYGWGTVKALRYRSDDGGVLPSDGSRASEAIAVDYVVSLIATRVYEPLPATSATPRQPLATAFVASSDVKFRSDDHRTAEECFADAEVLRNKGNAAFTAKDYDDAIVQYNRAVEALGSYKGELPLSATPPMKRAFMDAFLKSLGNIAQASLSKEPPDNETAFNMANEALNFDADDEFKYKGKNLRRRGQALFNLQYWKLSAQSFLEAMKADKTLAADPKLREKYAEAKAKADKEAAKEKKTWQGAFAKMQEGAAAGGAGDEDKSSGEADGGSSSKGEQRERGVRFVSPEKGDSSSQQAGSNSAVKASPASGGAGSEGSSNANAKRTLYAGHTPHPGKGGAEGGKKTKKRIITSTDDDDEDGDAEAQEEGNDDESGTATATKTEDEDEDEESEAPSGLQRALPWILGAGALAVGLGVLGKRRRWF